VGLSRRKQLAFWALTLALPVLLIGGIETGMRLSSRGQDLQLFTREHIGGRDYYVMNPGVKSRYFTRVEFQPTTSADYFPVHKAPGTFRIFCLGGSTTVGFPYGYAGSFPFLLRERLQRLFPERTIEVINLGMTATNSFTVLDIAGELPAYEPDLLLVYDGHNEFYGALGIASRESVARSRWLTRLYLHAIHSRVFLSLRDLYARVREGSATPHPGMSGTMMERLAKGQEIPYGSEDYVLALDMFRENVNDLVGVCRSHGIPLILGTQVSNVRDLPPFIAHHAPDIPAARLAEFDAAMNRGHVARRNGELDAASRAFADAYALDTAHAGACFEAARSMDALGRAGEARSLYAKARDLDQLRFRASTDFNAVILRAGRAPGVIVADCEEEFARVSRDRIVGSDLILEHVHPTQRGYALLARTYAHAMRTAGVLGSARDWAQRDTLDEESFKESLRLTELDERAAARRIRMLTSQWPFTTNTAVTPEQPPADAIDGIVAQLTGAQLSWEEAHVAAAGVYRKNNDRTNLEREYLTLIRVLPANVSAYLLLGDLYLRTGDHPAAASILRRSLAVEPTYAALNALGELAIESGRPDSARALLRSARGIAPNADARTRTDLQIARSYIGSRDTVSARMLLQQILEQRPGFSPARRLLNEIGGAQ
jgi:tetratricopeptide (TPR) repeat protein